MTTKAEVEIDARVAVRRVDEPGLNELGHCETAINPPYSSKLREMAGVLLKAV